MTKPLIDRLQDDIDALRLSKGDKVAIALLSTVRGEAARIGKDDGDRKTHDHEVTAVIRQFIKKLGQTIDFCKQNGRDTSAHEHELAILRPYAGKVEVDEATLAILREIIAANPDKAEQLKAKPGNVGWFVGQVKKATGGKADAEAVADLVKAELGL
jgi:Asp-tRNA(Asn)/Glu-tRNA(Gln) amidotransferase B subunit